MCLLHAYDLLLYSMWPFYIQFNFQLLLSLRGLIVEFVCASIFFTFWSINIASAFIISQMDTSLLHITIHGQLTGALMGLIAGVFSLGILVPIANTIASIVPEAAVWSYYLLCKMVSGTRRPISASRTFIIKKYEHIIVGRVYILIAKENILNIKQARVWQ